MGKEFDPAKELICYCFERTASDIRAAATRLGCSTFEDVADLILAGTGCTTCRSEVEKVLEELKRSDEPVGGDLPSGEKHAARSDRQAPPDR